MNDDTRAQQEAQLRALVMPCWACEKYRGVRHYISLWDEPEHGQAVVDEWSQA